MPSFLKSAISNVTNDSSNRTRSSSLKGDDDEVDLLPLLIIPGIMSSGLEVHKSCVNERYIGERVWINPIALGKGKLVLGQSFQATRKGDMLREMPKDFTAVADDSSDFSSDTEDEEDYDEEETKEEIDCKSPWLQHISLTSDMCSEREGNEIRPIPGLDGVDFLADIAHIHIGASYVFGPLIRLLKSVGYIECKNLDACPYDWRIPPSLLEERDSYFTKTMERIEQMVDENDDKPVVLLCHSMGGKVGHYLLNFAIQKLGPKAGKEWLDIHVHTYLPLGAVHTGVPSIIASAFSASLNPTLDPMLTKTERMVFSRSLGSAVWLMPTTLPSVERNAPPAIFCKAEGTLTIKILATPKNPIGDVNFLVANEYGTRTVEPFQVKVIYGQKDMKKKKSGSHGERVKVRSGVALPVDTPADHTFRKYSEEKPQYFELPSPKFLFSTPASLIDEETKESVLEPIQFVFYEKGDTRVKYLEKASRMEKSLRVFNRNIIAKKLRKYKTNLAMSIPIDDIDAHKLMKAGDEGITVSVPIVSRRDMTLNPTTEKRAIYMKVNMKWEPPQNSEEDDPTNPICSFPVDEGDLFAPVPEIRPMGDVLGLRTSDKYLPISGQAMLRREGLEDYHVKVARELYSPDVDPIGPRHKSSSSRPPVKRVYAIYGINVDTVVSTVCKRVSGYHVDKTPLEKQGRARFVMDKDTILRSGPNTIGGHKLEDGHLWEHSGTPQIDLSTGKRIKCCGDGSVPYYVLQQPQAWKKELNELETGDRIKIREIVGAEHRAILSDERFHKLLVSYLTGETSF